MIFFGVALLSATILDFESAIPILTARLHHTFASHYLALLFSSDVGIKGFPLTSLQPSVLFHPSMPMPNIIMQLSDACLVRPHDLIRAESGRFFFLLSAPSRLCLCLRATSFSAQPLHVPVTPMSESHLLLTLNNISYLLLYQKLVKASPVSARYLRPFAILLRS